VLNAICLGCDYEICAMAWGGKRSGSGPKRARSQSPDALQDAKRKAKAGERKRAKLTAQARLALVYVLALIFLDVTA